MMPAARRYDVGGVHLHQRQLGRPVMVHAAAAIAICAIYEYFDQASVTLIAGGAIATVGYIALGIMEARRAAMVLTPLSLYFFWYSIDRGAAAVYHGDLLVREESVSFALNPVSREDLAKAYVIFVLGSLALHLGMQLLRPRELPNRSKIANTSHRSLAPVAAVYLMGLVVLRAPTLLASIGNLAAPLQWAAIAALASLAVSGPPAFGLSSTAFLLLLAFGTTGLLWGEITTGSKALIMFSLIPAFWMCAIRPPLRRYLPLMTVGALLLYSVVYPVVSLSRSKVVEQAGDASDRISRAYREWSSTGTPDGGEESTSEQFDQFMTRQFDPIPVGFFVREVRSRGLMMGSTMDYALYALIPRVLWPDKPAVTRGAWFTFYLRLAADPSVATTSTGETATGELYWNFGAFGVVIGMFIIGLMVGELWRMAGADPRGDVVRMVLFVSIMMNMPNMPEAVTVVVGLASSLLIFSVIFALQSVVASLTRRVNVSVAPA